MKKSVKNTIHFGICILMVLCAIGTVVAFSPQAGPGMNGDPGQGQNGGMPQMNGQQPPEMPNGNN